MGAASDLRRRSLTSVRPTTSVNCSRRRTWKRMSPPGREAIGMAGLRPRDEPTSTWADSSAEQQIEASRGQRRSGRPFTRTSVSDRVLGLHGARPGDPQTRRRLSRYSCHRQTVDHVGHKFYRAAYGAIAEEWTCYDTGTHLRLPAPRGLKGRRSNQLSYRGRRPDRQTSGMNPGRGNSRGSRRLGQTGSGEGERALRCTRAALRR